MFIQTDELVIKTLPSQNRAATPFKQVTPMTHLFCLFFYGQWRFQFWQSQQTTGITHSIVDISWWPCGVSKSNSQDIIGFILYIYIILYLSLFFVPTREGDSGVSMSFQCASRAWACRSPWPSCESDVATFRSATCPADAGDTPKNRTTTVQQHRPLIRKD